MIKRIALATVGYLVSVISFFVVLALIFAAAAKLIDGTGAWSIAGVSPILAFGAPLAALFLIVMAIVLSAIPMLIAAVLTEWFRWRSTWVYVIPCAALAAAVYLYLSPRTTFGISLLAATETLIFAVSGAVAGLVYWAIAGRNAGIQAPEGAA